MSLSWIGKRDAIAIVSSMEAHRGTHEPWWKVGDRATRARYRWEIAEERRDEKRNSPSLLLFPWQENHNKSIDGTPARLLGIERIPGYLTSIVRIRVAVAVATAIVNTILNSIENLSPRLKRRPATEEDVRHPRSGVGMGVDKVRDISKSYFCFSRGSFRLIRSRNFRPVLGSISIPISLLSNFSFPVLSSMIIGEFVFLDDVADAWENYSTAFYTLVSSSAYYVNIYFSGRWNFVTLLLFPPLSL